MKRTTPLTRHIGGKVREYRLKNKFVEVFGITYNDLFAQ